MVEALIWIGVFIVSLAILIKSSDYFTEAAEKLSLYYGIPAYLIGVTIVAVGTSLPELLSSIFAVIGNNSEIIIGNVAGSNITNILLIIGIAAIISKKQLKTSWELIHVDLPLLMGSAILLVATTMDGKFTLFEAILSLSGFVVYIGYTYAMQKGTAKKETTKKKAKLGWKIPTILILSPVFIGLSAKYFVDSIVNLAGIYGIATGLLAASVVALGTSLPELMVTISAARRGNLELVLGNVLGSNIFNAFVVMGVPGLIGTLLIPKSLIVFTLPFMLLVTFYYFFVTQDKVVSKWEGYMLLITYVFFFVHLFAIGFMT